LAAFLFFRRFFSRAFRGAAFSSPFRPVKKGDVPTGPTNRMTTQKRALRGSVCRTTEVEPRPSWTAPRRSAGEQGPAEDRRPVVANAIGHIDERAGVFARENARRPFRCGVSRVRSQPGTVIESCATGSYSQTPQPKPRNPKPTTQNPPTPDNSMEKSGGWIECIKPREPTFVVTMYQTSTLRGAPPCSLRVHGDQQRQSGEFFRPDRFLRF
jgi:hypothetical protein